MEFLVNYGFQVIGAIIILCVGVFVARKLSNLIIKICEKQDLDLTLSTFFGNVVKIVVLTFVVIVVLGKFGISIAPFVAAIGAAALGASFAIQGPLSNYGAGLAIILTRPFVIGDTLTVKGVSGVVYEISLAYTLLTTEDEERITIPNNQIMGEILQNSFNNKVVESTIGIAYQDDPVKAVDIIRKTLKQFAQISSDSPPQIGIEAFGDSSINIGIRYWVPTKKYFQTTYAVNLSVYQALKDSKIRIPYPQREVRMISQPATTDLSYSQGFA
ncbi:MAG: mechanosensitive ion channel family protein [Desulfobacterales bacterium]|nr:MAG: mechanosensitive ion channel family protein [Desulfobacterales bacterium]